MAYTLYKLRNEARFYFQNSPNFLSLPEIKKQLNKFFT